MPKTLDFNKLVENAQKVESGKQKKEFKPDQRYFQIAVNKEGTFSGVVRFLSPKEEDDTFFVSVYSHSFQVAGRKIFTTCPTTIGEKCAICDYNREHWNEYSKQEQSDRKRKLKYHSNIYVVSDPENPTREGKVFLWAYGIGVYKKIMNMIAPRKDVPKPKKPYNIFDEKTGKDFELMVGLKDGNNNYDECNFSDEPSELCDGDPEKIKEVYSSLYLLKDVLPKKEDLKSYEDTQKWLMRTLTGQKQDSANVSTKAVNKEVADSDLWPTEESANKNSEKKTESVKEEVATSEDDFFNFEDEK